MWYLIFALYFLTNFLVIMRDACWTDKKFDDQDLPEFFLVTVVCLFMPCQLWWCYNQIPGVLTFLFKERKLK
jgi:hypothetical protein